MNKPINIDIESHPKSNAHKKGKQASIISTPSNGPQFSQFLEQHNTTLTHTHCQELQINLGKLCNLACHHCHVEAGPKRTEIMTWETMQKLLQWLENSDISRVDLTGGAPELNPHFRKFCHALLEMNISITSRCNLTVLFEPGQADLAQWYANNNIRLVCSLPCYTADNVEAQRGKGVFDKSIRGLQLLNKLGYAKDKPLDLVYNPLGAFLPANQTELEEQYRQRLFADFGIEFSHLLTVTNVPINRFAHALKRSKELDSYQSLLVENFNIDTIDGLMCRHQLSIDWQGRVFDCDFNQMLEMSYNNKPQQFLWQINASDINGSHIMTDRHCFACTAGSGSSCGGALTD